MNNIYIGIDPSINSTGIDLLLYDEDHEKVLENMYIIHGGKLSKAELSYIDKYPYFLYKVYLKYELKDYDSNTGKEIAKTNNLIGIVYLIEDIIKDYYNVDDLIKVVIEGIAFASTKTVSLMDLAGLNYLIRNMIITRYPRIILYIAPPDEIKKFVTGYGHASKGSLINAFKMIHRGFEVPKMDDLADSYFMCEYAKNI